MKLNITTAWEEAVAMVSANREVLAVLAGVFFLLPGLALELFLPKPAEPASEDPKVLLEMLQTYWAMAAPYVLGMFLMQTIGQLAVNRLLGGQPGATVGEALREALGGLPILILVQLLLAFAWMVAGIVLIGLPAAAGVPALSILTGLALLVVAIWAGARLSLIPPLIAIEAQRNPVAIIRRSWDLTRGNAGMILVFLLLVLVVAIVTSIVATVIGGLLGTVLMGEHGGAIAAGVISSLLSAVFTLYVTATVVAFYRQLTGAVPALRVFD